MTAEILTIVALVAPLVIYVAVRFGSAAFFKSKQQYEQQRKNHG